MTPPKTIHLVTPTEPKPETPAAASSRLSEQAAQLALAAENAALGVWREALAEAEALRDLSCASVGGRQIGADVARDLRRSIDRMLANHSRRS